MTLPALRSSSALAIFLRMAELFSIMKSSRPSSVRGVMAAAGLPLRVMITGSPATTLLRSSFVLFLSSTVFAIFICVPPYSYYNSYMTGSQPHILPFTAKRGEIYFFRRVHFQLEDQNFPFGRSWSRRRRSSCLPVRVRTQTGRQAPALLQAGRRVYPPEGVRSPLGEAEGPGEATGGGGDKGGGGRRGIF